jgi:hypothetical protein
VYGARDTKENEAIVLRQFLLQERARPADWDPSTKLLLVMAVVAAAHHDAVASASGVELFASPLLTAREISAARTELVSNGLLRTASDGWQLTSRAHRQVRELS